MDRASIHLRWKEVIGGGRRVVSENLVEVGGLRLNQTTPLSVDFRYLRPHFHVLSQPLHLCPPHQRPHLIEAVVVSGEYNIGHGVVTLLLSPMVSESVSELRH